MFAAASAQAEINVRFDDQAARITLAALKRRDLTADAANTIAAEQGNIASIRQANRFDKKANAAAFSDALLKIASGRHLDASDDPLRLQNVADNFDDVERLSTLLQKNRNSITETVRSRVSSFSPKGVDLNVVVVFVVGGTSDGWAPDSAPNDKEKRFYIALNMFKGDIGGLQLLLSHELYHIVQSYAQAGKEFSSNPAVTKSDRDAWDLLAEVTKEGTASLVGDATNWPTDGPYVQWYKRKFVQNLNRIDQASFLLESVLLHVIRDGIPSESPAYDLLFSAGWDSNAYFVGYYMAKYIKDREGTEIISKIILSGDATELIRQYLILSESESQVNRKLTFSASFVHEIERLRRLYSAQLSKLMN